MRLRSLRCFSLLTILTTLFYFTTVKWKSLTTLNTVFYFTAIKMKYLTTLTTLPFFTTIKWKSLTTLTTLFYFTDYALRCSYLLSTKQFFPRNFSVVSICMCDSNFTVKKLSGVLHALLPLKFALLGLFTCFICFSDLITEVEIWY